MAKPLEVFHVLPFAEIHFALPLSRGYTYRVPESLDAIAQIGCRALVPLGKRVATGFIVRRTDKIDFPTKKLCEGRQMLGMNRLTFFNKFVILTV